MEHLNRLVRAGALRDQDSFLKGRRFHVADQDRAAQVRARLDAIARSQGPVDWASAAVAGLVCATGLDFLVYRGRGTEELRGRLEEVGTGQATTPGSGTTAADVITAADGAARAEVARAKRGVPARGDASLTNPATVAIVAWAVSQAAGPR
jgi:hypothetical protein